MAIAWTDSQEASVDELLRDHPIESNRCANLACALLQIARQRDADAHGVLIKPKPGEGRFVEPRAGGRGWYYHATVSAEGHYVDVLTGKPGTECDQYLHRHWLHIEVLHVERNDLSELCF